MKMKRLSAARLRSRLGWHAAPFPNFSAATRLMLIAPHPDDEALAGGIMLQRAVRAGAAIRVVYVTDGDNNPWPQRALQRKWRLRSRDRERWARLRRSEARAALRMLGVDAADATFLGLPDQGLTELLVSGGERLTARLEATITTWRPNLLVVPSYVDTHADHSAIGVILSLLQAPVSTELSDLSLWSYRVHGRGRAFTRAASALDQSQEERATKLAAILCHKTQMMLSRGRFVKYASRPERFRELYRNQSASVERVIRGSIRTESELRLKLRLPLRALPAVRPRLVLLGRGEGSDQVIALTARRPARTRAMELTDYNTGATVGRLTYRGDASAGEAVIPTTMFAADSPLFLRLDGGDFLDRGRWIEIDPVAAIVPVKTRAAKMLFARTANSLPREQARR